MSDDRRTSFVNALGRGELHPAIQAARQMLLEDAGGRTWTFLRNAVGKADAALLGLKPLRVALLSSFSIEFIHDALIAQGFLNELRVEIYQPGFAQFRQEIIDPASGLYAFQPDAVVLAVEGQHLVPAVYQQYLDRLEDGFDGVMAEVVEEIWRLFATFRQRSDATLLVHNLVPPRWRGLGVLDGHVGTGQGRLVGAVNDALYDAARAQRGVYVVDYAGLVGRVGLERWVDQRMEHYAQLPIAQTALPHLAAEYMKFFRALRGRTRKCLVVDLDNTLWGGVVGEGGSQGIALGPEYPGSAFMAFQRAILELGKRGVLLAIASKNNEADVQEVFADHPHMVLKREHFVHTEIHWSPKTESLAAIARALNIGLEHVVFVDDNPVECELIRTTLPMVTVIQLPRQPEKYVDALLGDGWFDGLSYSAEDSRRLELYRQRAEAEEARAQSGSLAEFHRSLEMEVIFAPVDDASLGRTAQLTQKTNQFNTTTRRYTDAEVADRLTRADWLVRTVRVRDRFGDHGIVGIVMAHQEGDALEVDTFLMSCRVIGRTVETAMLAHLCEEAARRGVPHVRGEVIFTKKNEPARDLYERHGFERSRADAEGTTWVVHVARHGVAYPPWLTVRQGEPAGREAR